MNICTSSAAAKRANLDAEVATVAIARGDGIGPEIMDASLRVLDAAGAQLRYLPLELGEAVYLQGHSAGITDAGWETIAASNALFKAPITTPLGGGFKSLNVTLRKTLGLYANVRPVAAYAPFVETRHPAMDVVIVRENEEDLYAGIEHRQTDQVYQCLKLVSRPGCERIIRYAFEYARTNGRRKVTCFSKSNIMKLTDGLFQQVFEEIGAEYPDIIQDHM
ncbi:MAG TPA: isocitrate/isopropylmalate family dehydrogenase, partial [Sphingorhabdus sp.]|nr:isocitrate/isopropylmalate family dehydrogenase [Sphingorhabdus sp.]